MLISRYCDRSVIIYSFTLALPSFEAILGLLFDECLRPAPHLFILQSICWPVLLTCKGRFYLSNLLCFYALYCSFQMQLFTEFPLSLPVICICLLYFDVFHFILLFPFPPFHHQHGTSGCLIILTLCSLSAAGVFLIVDSELCLQSYCVHLFNEISPKIK